jgi:hypothetical protein
MFLHGDEREDACVHVICDEKYVRPGDCNFRRLGDVSLRTKKLNNTALSDPLSYLCGCARVASLSSMRGNLRCSRDPDH